MVNNGFEIPEIDLEGFQVVSGDMFTHFPKKSEPTCTLWCTSISFSKTAIMSLNSCERVRIEIHPEKKNMLIVPVTLKDRDGIRWSKGVKDQTSRKIECKAFTSKLYELWGFKIDYVYRATGRVVCADKKVMLLFNFSETENWKYKKKEEKK